MDAMTPVYLDHNASVPVRPHVAEAMAAALAQPGNPSSVHGFGRAARRRVEDAREQVAALVGAAPDRVVFTSGGTEANALALRGCGRRRVLVSAIEHDSVLKAVDEPEVIAVDGRGVVDLSDLKGLLEAEDEPALVSVMLANNETGIIQPVAEAARLAHQYGALVHCDAVQAAGKTRVSLDALGVDFLTLSAHKIGGPQGVGALVMADDALDLSPLLAGGGQERGRRSGTENVSGIVGFGVAARDAICERLAILELRDELERRALALAPDARVVGSGQDRLPNTTCLLLPGVGAQVQVMALDLAGVAVSAGSACSSGKVKASRVLRAMGFSPELSACAIRVSLGWNSAADDVERFLDAWRGVVARAREKGPAASAA